jgi:hypothetical protein
MGSDDSLDEQELHPLRLETMGIIRMENRRSVPLTSPRIFRDIYCCGRHMMAGKR